MNTYVVKVQRPLYTTDPNAGVLVYARKRKNMVEQPLTSTVSKAMGSTHKAFFQAEWNGKSWDIGKRVADEGW